MSATYVTISAADAALISKLLTLASDKFSNHMCNDFTVEDNSHTQDLIRRMAAWDDPELIDNEPDSDGKFWLLDWMLMHFYADLLKEKC